MKKPLVTIITPSYNQGNFIEYTIQSVLNQTYTNIEYIVIDGGSKDATIDILKQYHIRYISEKDNGQADAINKGFKIAKGEIIGWINSDDILHKDCVSSVVSTFEGSPDTGLVYGNYIEIDENGNAIREVKKNDISLYKLLNVNGDVCQPGSFYRKNFVEQVNYVDENLNYVMDYDLWIKLMKVSKVEYLDKVLAYFRLHDASKTVAHIEKFAPEMEAVIRRNGGSILALPSSYLKNKYFRQYYSALIPKIVKAFDKCSDKKVGIYGIGGHTLTMLEMCKSYYGNIDFDVYFFDSSTSKVGTIYMGKKVLGVQEISDLKLDRLIISSYTFQEQIYTIVRELIEESKIIKLYDNDDYIFFC